MEIDLWYWISEYGKVFCGYLFLMLLWPLVVFHGYLKGKSKTFCFGFCTAVTVVIANTAVLGLGLFHILDQWLIRLGFYGVFAGALSGGDREPLQGREFPVGLLRHYISGFCIQC